VQPYIALTDQDWFDFFSARTPTGLVDEVNFWSPKSTRPLKHMEPGAPVFFRLKRPYHAIAGYAFFAHFQLLDLDMAWDYFGWKNGDPDKVHFFQRIGEYRGLDLFDPQAPRQPLGCTILRGAVFWPESRWIPWGDHMGWPRHVQQGNTERDPARVELLLHSIASKAPEELETAKPFEPLVVDERRVALVAQAEREGQGTFRARLLDAYGGRCAITGEHTEPVLDAAHIQPYLGPRSNHLQNGLLLTKEFHTLFDRGYVTITPEHVIRVSPRLRSEWNNGKRYYPYDGQPLVQLPEQERNWPSKATLAWHNERVFRSAA
jgi:putative restriction endonuclease